MQFSSGPRWAEQAWTCSTPLLHVPARSAAAAQAFAKSCRDPAKRLATSPSDSAPWPMADVVAKGGIGRLR
eukprot:4892315-Prymnesium_polylepis.3